MTLAPDKQEPAGDGRDPVTGRFLPGVSGNPKGRPRGWDFRKIVQEKAKRQGIEVEDSVWEVYLALLKMAKEGDVSAAKLVLDRLCDMETQSDDLDDARRLRADLDEIDRMEGGKPC